MLLPLDQAVRPIGVLRKLSQPAQFFGAQRHVVMPECGNGRNQLDAQSCAVFVEGDDIGRFERADATPRLA